MIKNHVTYRLNQEVTKRLGLVAGLQLGYNKAKHGYNIYLIQEYTYNACHSAEALAKEEGERSITACTATQLCGSATQHKYLIYRGYTNHEHLEEFALINMNGRMYDPIIGRMLSPDNYVQSGLADNYNRYSYVLNNPLKYNDPSGEYWHIVIGAAIGGTVNVAMNWKTIQNSNDPTLTGLAYFGIGALAGGLGAGIGAGVGAMAMGSSFGAGFVCGATTIGFTAGFASGAAGGFTSGFISGTGNSWMQGNDLSTGIGSGLKNGLIGGVSGGLITGTVSGIYALNHGGSFWNGAGTKQYLYASEMPDLIESGKEVEYSNSSAKDFSDKYFHDVKGVNSLYADNSVPSGNTLSSDGLYGVDAKGKEFLGVTDYLGKGQSNVYLMKGGFSSPEKLYLVMGHEYIHATFNNLSMFNGNKQEATCRLWMYDQAKAFNYSGTSSVENIYKMVASDYSSKYAYSLLGFTILSKTPW